MFTFPNPSLIKCMEHSCFWLVHFIRTVRKHFTIIIMIIIILNPVLIHVLACTCGSIIPWSWEVKVEYACSWMTRMLMTIIIIILHIIRMYKRIYDRRGAVTARLKVVQICVHYVSDCT